MPKTPSYRLRPGYTQAIVTLTDSRTGKRRDYWLGEHGSPESRERYHLLIAEWEANGRRLPAPPGSAAARVGDAAAPGAAGDGEATVLHVIRAYWRFARQYYRPNEYGTLRVALRLLKQFYGRSPAADFGPKKLRLVRDAMVRGDAAADPPRRPWSRVYINQQTRRIRQMFRWAASHEMIPPEVYQALATVEPLKRGRCAAREGKKVAPVPLEMIDAVRPHLNRQVAALVDLQLLTGARSGELLGLRAIDIDMSDRSGVWAYRPKEHKNRFRGKDRVIYFGPAAQAVVRPFLTGRAVDAFLFSPAEAEAERRAALHAQRTTPLCCGNRPGTNRRAKPERAPGDRYTAPSYYVAVQRACDEAFPPPEHLRRRTLANGRPETTAQWEARLTPEQKAELRAWRKAHRWHPHQLRHNAGTAIRREFGLEAAQLVLGHSSAQITDAVYAERDAAKVVEVMQKIG